MSHDCSITAFKRGPGYGWQVFVVKCVRCGVVGRYMNEDEANAAYNDHVVNHPTRRDYWKNVFGRLLFFELTIPAAVLLLAIMGMGTEPSVFLAITIGMQPFLFLISTTMGYQKSWWVKHG